MIISEEINLSSREEEDARPNARNALSSRLRAFSEPDALEPPSPSLVFYK